MSKFEEFLSKLVVGQRYTIVGEDYKEDIVVNSVKIDIFQKNLEVVYLLYKNLVSNKTEIRILFQDTLPIVLTS